MNEPKTCRILRLDGGGAKGFYTLGVLKQLEALLGDKPLSEQFDLIFGTSTGAIIASLLALGYKVDDIHTRRQASSTGHPPRGAVRMANGCIFWGNHRGA